MAQYIINTKSKKAFLRWCAKGAEDYQRAVSYALETLLPMIEDTDFKWVDKTPDGHKNPSFYVEMARTTERGYECISFNFNKDKKLKFAVAFTISDPSAEYARTAIGGLVPRKSDDYNQFWWGASLLSLNKEKTFKSNVDKVAKLIPQIIDFFATEAVGANIWVSWS